MIISNEGEDGATIQMSGEEKDNLVTQLEAIIGDIPEQHNDEEHGRHI